MIYEAPRSYLPAKLLRLELIPPGVAWTKGVCLQWASAPEWMVFVDSQLDVDESLWIKAYEYDRIVL